MYDLKLMLSRANNVTDLSGISFGLVTHKCKFLKYEFLKKPVNTAALLLFENATIIQEY